jgi:hypothetical protein
MINSLVSVLFQLCAVCAQVGTLAFVMALPLVVVKHVSLSFRNSIPKTNPHFIVRLDFRHGIIDAWRPRRKHLWQL